MNALTHVGARFLAAAVIAAVLNLPVDAYPDETPANAYCPVTTDEPVEPDIFAEYEGRKVFFCCRKCRNKFLADPERYLAALPVAGRHGEETHRDGRTEAGHDHAHDHGSGPSAAAAFLGKLHPVTVHFPIALFVMTGIGELLLIMTGRSRFGDFAHISLWFGTASGFAAGLFGWLNKEGRTWEGVDAELVSNHERAAITLLVVAILSLIVRPRSDGMNDKRLMIYHVLVVLLVLLTMLTGHLGGSLVYGPGYLSW